MVAVIGDATPYAHWGFHIVQRLIEAIAGATVHLHITSLEEMRAGFAQRGGANVVVTSDFPDADCARLICSSDVPIIAFVEDPNDTLNWIVKTRNLSIVDAVRFATRVFSAVAPPLTARRTLLIDRGASPARIVSEIAGHIFPGRGDTFSSAAFALVEQISGDAIVDRSVYLNGVDVSAADAEGLADMRTVLAGYTDLSFGRRPKAFTWPLAMFTRTDKRPTSAPLDLTGPARALLYGPYLHLPVGDWIARLEFEVDGALSSVEATTDVYIDGVVTEKMFTMPVKGVYAYELSFSVVDPHAPVQLRLFTNKSAIEGVFLLRSVRVRSAQPRPRQRA